MRSPTLKPPAVFVIVHLRCLLWAAAICLAVFNLQAGVKPTRAAQPPLYISFLDQTSPQVTGPSINGLEDRRRGPIFAAALEQAVGAGKLPPVAIINKDLSMPSTILDEAKIPAGKVLTRIYLTQWSHTRLGGIADTEILCRFYVDLVRDGHVIKKLGPFFAASTFNVDFATPQDRWKQYQAVALKAIAEMKLPPEA